MSDETLEGTVVDQASGGSLANPHGGLYLSIGAGKTLRLISDGMQTQLPVDVMHGQSRGDFEKFLNKNVKVQGYLSGGTIYSARIID